jgi:hypothetical protein
MESIMDVPDNDDEFLHEAIELLGFDPMTMGSLCYEILSTDLIRRFREQGYAKTFDQIRRAKSLAGGS